MRDLSRKCLCGAQYRVRASSRPAHEHRILLNQTRLKATPVHPAFQLVINFADATLVCPALLLGTRRSCVSVRRHKQVFADAPTVHLPLPTGPHQLFLRNLMMQGFVRPVYGHPHSHYFFADEYAPILRPADCGEKTNALLLTILLNQKMPDGRHHNVEHMGAA